MSRPALIAKLLILCVAAIPMLTGGNAAAQESTHRVVRLAELEIDPAQLDRYKILLAEEIETSVRLEPGVLSLNAVSLKDAPTRIRILEVYADNDAYEAHLNSAHFLQYKSATASMVKSLNLLETTPIMLCSKSDDGCQGN